MLGGTGVGGQPRVASPPWQGIPSGPLPRMPSGESRAEQGTSASPGRNPGAWMALWGASLLCFWGPNWKLGNDFLSRLG